MIQWSEVKRIKPPILGFMGFGIVTTVLQATLVIAFVWLVIKLGTVLSAYESKLKA